MKSWGLILLLLLLVSGLAIGAGVSILHNGLSASATTAMEALLARNARHLAIPANARNERNPVTPSDPILQEAMAHFADHCATCQGSRSTSSTPSGTYTQRGDGHDRTGVETLLKILHWPKKLDA